MTFVGSGQKEIRTDWPHVEGDIFSETKTHDREPALIPTENDLVPRDARELL